MGRNIGHIICTIVILLSFLSFDSKSQINPPDLQCIRGDTLIWQLPFENCGPFLSYDIYASQNPDGPFNLILSITDPVATFGIHTNSSGIWYYYMISNFDCPGLIPISSDTLDNRSPAEPEIIVATVENDDVLIEWVPSSSPQVIGHIIYRATQMGTVPIDTVYLPDNSYLDISADINNQAEFYYVLAMDFCGNTSGFIKFHKTIYHEIVQDPCDRSFLVEWNPYEGFNEGVENYELTVLKDGALIQTIDITNDSGISRVFNIENDTEYCITITATENISGVVANSNTVCLIGEVRTPLNEFDYTAFTIVNDQLLLEFEYNEDYEFVEFYIATSFDSEFIQNEVVTLTTTSTLDGHSALLPFDVSRRLPIYATVSSLDVCDNIVVQDTLKSIFLSGIPNPDGTNDLVWNELIWPGSTIISYELNFIQNNQASLIYTGAVVDEVFTHNFNNISAGPEGFCYQVDAILAVPTSSGNIDVLSQSNIACVEQESVIFMANAFKPGGVNPQIAPVIRYPESVATYEFHVFDRFGSLIYASNSINEGWRGNDSKGKDLQTGVYAYRVFIKQNNGAEASLQGTILLLR